MLCKESHNMHLAFAQETNFTKQLVTKFLFCQPFVQKMLPKWYLHFCNNVIFLKHWFDSSFFTGVTLSQAVIVKVTTILLVELVLLDTMFLKKNKKNTTSQLLKSIESLEILSVYNQYILDWILQLIKNNLYKGSLCSVVHAHNTRYKNDIDIKNRRLKFISKNLH